MTNNRTARLEAFAAPARRKPELWRLLLGTGLCVAVFLGGLNLTAVLLVGLFGMPAAALPGADMPIAVLLLLAGFGWLALGPVLAVRLLHRRTAASLFGPRARLGRDFAVAALVIGVIQGLALAGWFAVNDAAANLDPRIWAALLPLALAGIAVQTMAEEMVFRGYLLQQLAARFASPLAWAVLPSALFGLLHYEPGGGAEAWLIVLATAIIGLLAADLTAATGSLGAAWGLHFANNAGALLILSTDGAIPGLALFVAPDPGAISGWLIVADIAVLLVAWAALRRVLVR